MGAQEEEEEEGVLTKLGSLAKDLRQVAKGDHRGLVGVKITMPLSRICVNRIMKVPLDYICSTYI